MKLTTDRYIDFPEDPNAVRWRAWWDWDSYGEKLRGIVLRCYPVIKVTPQGAWIDPDAYHHGTWVLSGNRRWVSNDGGQAWAKPTKSAATFSLAYRFSRWGSRLHNEINRYFAASYALETLLPDQSFRAKDGRGIVASATAPRGVLTPAPNAPMLPTNTNLEPTP